MLPERSKNLESAILDALYNDSCNRPGDSEGMALMDLLETIGINSNDTGIFRSKCFSLTEKQWIKSKLLEDGTGGSFLITSAGKKITEDRRKTTRADSIQQNKQVQNYCPETLGDLAQRDENCARFIHRYDLLSKIKNHIENGEDHFIQLSGQIRTGKTTLLRKLPGLLAKERYTPLMITTQGNEKDNLDMFVHSLSSQLTIKFNDWAKQNSDIQPLSDPEQDDFKEGYGVTAFYKHWRNLKNRIGDRYPVLLYDEIESLLEHPGESDCNIKFIRDFMNDRSNGYFIVTTSVRSEENKHFSNLMENAKYIPLHYYEDAEVALVFSFIRQCIKDEYNLLQHFVALSDGHPKILDAFLSIVSYKINSKNKEKVTIDEFNSMLVHLIDHIDGYLKQLLNELSPEEKHIVQLIGQKLPDTMINDMFDFEHSLIESIESEYTQRKIPGMEKGLNSLQRRGWIERKNKEKEMFRFKLGILPYWFQHYYRG